MNDLSEDFLIRISENHQLPDGIDLIADAKNLCDLYIHHLDIKT